MGCRMGLDGIWDVGWDVMRCGMLGVMGLMQTLETKPGHPASIYCPLTLTDRPPSVTHPVQFHEGQSSVII